MSTVLVVDDTLFMRVTLSNMLEEWGYTIVGQAENGRQAIDMYKIHMPDIVTMDLTMPILSGIEAVKGIIEFDSNAKIIVVSALGQKRHIQQAIELGAKDFVTKPFEPSHLKEVVENVLSRAI